VTTPAELADAVERAGHGDLAAELRQRGDAGGEVIDMNEHIRAVASGRTPYQLELAQRFGLIRPTTTRRARHDASLTGTRWGGAGGSRSSEAPGRRTAAFLTQSA
jgi:hypothetical protein